MGIRAECVVRLGYGRRSHNAANRIYDQVGNLIERHEHKGDFREW